MTPYKKPLAAGATAEIYPWTDGQVVKLFRAEASRASAEFERRVAGSVHAAVGGNNTFSVPAVGPVVETDGARFGLVYERIDGRSLSDVVLNTLPHPIAATARRLAEIHAAIHAVSPVALGDALPELRTRLHQRVASLDDERLPDTPRNAACLCHGDLHPENVLITGDGKAVVIDWRDATLGDPLADVARTCLLLRFGTPPDGVPSSASSSLTPEQYEVARRTFHDTYLDHYLTLNPFAGGRERVALWLPVLAAFRLSENIAPAERSALRGFIGDA